jgi:thiol-disulfide isomerase/thioredoxin
MRFAFVTALTLASLAAQTQYPDGAKLSEQAAAALKGFHTLRYKEDVTMETTLAGQHMKIDTQTSRAMVNPGKMRMDTSAQGMSMSIVSDGDQTWMYSSMGNEYTRKSAGMGAQGLMEGMGIGSMMPNVSDIHLSQKTAGEETITIDDQKHDCWVVRTEMGALDLPAAAKGGKVSGGTIITWFDKKLFLDLQQDVTMKVSVGGMDTETHIKTVKKDLVIDGPVAASTFVFTPPEGAKEVDKLSLFGGMGSTPDLAGKPAPDFTVQGLDGKPYSLASLKGKPVLLDFWATWCGPCRKAMPSVEKLFQDYKDQGLTVLAVDGAEDRQLVEDFLKTNPIASPAALSGETTILKDYDVTAFPTFVLIGADGKIADYQAGFGGDDMLHEMLEKAGITIKK